MSSPGRASAQHEVQAALDRCTRVIQASCVEHMHDFQDGALRQELSAAWEALEVHLNSADAAGLQAILL